MYGPEQVEKRHFEKKKKIREENRERREENEEMSAKKDQEIRLFRGNTFSQKSAPPALSLLLKKK